MKTLKLTLAAIALSVGVYTATFAGEPKAEKCADATATKSEVKAVTKSTDGPVTYWITGTTTLNGHPAYTFDQNAQECDGEGEPCQFTSLNGAVSSPQLQSDIESSSNYTVDTRKN